MLTSLRIQNFRSIRDASVKLGQVNLFIGPNNSGKSNFLKGIELLGEIITEHPNEVNFTESEFYRLITRSKDILNEKIASLNFEFRFRSLKNQEDFTSKVSFSNTTNNRSQLEITSPQSISINRGPISTTHSSGELLPMMSSIRALFHRTKRYHPDPTKFSRRTKPSYEFDLTSNGSNLVSFLFNISQSYGNEFEALLIDFRACIRNLVRISTPPDPESNGYIKLKFFDKNNIDFWAEEVSEGVLYFLALLCIVHQPNPPRLLLLEEPEKGIHPRRIKEVMDFIFELAQLRDIQIILTSHSPYVVDYFADIPECISVFDRENGETVIRNAGDLINETNERLVAEGKKPIRYTDSLGEHWVSGFLGGVPA